MQPTIPNLTIVSRYSLHPSTSSYVYPRVNWTTVTQTCPVKVQGTVVKVAVMMIYKYHLALPF